MSFPSLSSLEIIKKWLDYWRKFKGKRVRIWLRRGTTLTKAMLMAGDSIKIDFLDNIVGTISEVIESPFGIMLKDTSSTMPDIENTEMIFVPMSEISRMDFLKQD